MEETRGKGKISNSPRIGDDRNWQAERVYLVVIHPENALNASIGSSDLTKYVILFSRWPEWSIFRRNVCILSLEDMDITV